MALIPSGRKEIVLFMPSKAINSKHNTDEDQNQKKAKGPEGFSRYADWTDLTKDSWVKAFVMWQRCTALLCYSAVRYLPSGNCSDKAAILTLPVTHSQRIKL